MTFARSSICIIILYAVHKIPSGSENFQRKFTRVVGNSRRYRYIQISTPRVNLRDRMREKCLRNLIERVFTDTHKRCGWRWRNFFIVRFFFDFFFCARKSFKLNNGAKTPKNVYVSRNKGHGTREWLLRLSADNFGVFCYFSSTPGPVRKSNSTTDPKSPWSHS